MIGEPVLVTVTLNVNSCYCGRNLTTIQLPEACIFLGVVRAGKVILVKDEDIELWCGDYVMAIAFKRLLVPALKVILHKTHRVSWFPVRSHRTETKSLQLVNNSLDRSA